MHSVARLVPLLLLVGCATTHGPENDAAAPGVTDAFVMNDADALGDASESGAADARAACSTWPRATVVPPPGERSCIDQRVPTTSGVSCTGRGAFIEVASGTDAPMRSVTIEREHAESDTRLCISAYDDCTCRDTQCLERGEAYMRVDAHAYRRLFLENEGEPVRVVVCN